MPKALVFVFVCLITIDGAFAAHAGEGARDEAPPWETAYDFLIEFENKPIDIYVKKGEDAAVPRTLKVEELVLLSESVKKFKKYRIKWGKLSGMGFQHYSALLGLLDDYVGVLSSGLKGRVIDGELLAAYDFLFGEYHQAKITRFPFLSAGFKKFDYDHLSLPAYTINSPVFGMYHEQNLTLEKSFNYMWTPNTRQFHISKFLSRHDKYKLLFDEMKLIIEKMRLPTEKVYPNIPADFGK